MVSRMGKLHRTPRPGRSAPSLSHQPAATPTAEAQIHRGLPGTRVGCIVPVTAEVAVQRKLCLRSSGVALIALILASCGKSAPPGAATLEAWVQFRACVTSVIEKPEYDQLRVHTVDLDTLQPARAELTDEAIPSAQDARLFAARFDAVNPCREDLLRAVAIPDRIWFQFWRMNSRRQARSPSSSSNDRSHGPRPRGAPRCCRVTCGKRLRRRTSNGLLTSSHSTNPIWRKFEPQRHGLSSSRL